MNARHEDHRDERYGHEDDVFPLEDHWEEGEVLEEPEWFADLVDGRLDAEQRARAERELDADPALREAFAGYQNTVRALADCAEDDEPCPADLKARIHAALLREASPRPLAWMTSRRGRWALLGSVAVAAASLALYFTTGIGGRFWDAEQAAPTEVASNAAEPKRRPSTEKAEKRGRVEGEARQSRSAKGAEELEDHFGAKSFRGGTAAGAPAGPALPGKAESETLKDHEEQKKTGGLRKLEIPTTAIEGSLLAIVERTSRIEPEKLTAGYASSVRRYGASGWKKIEMPGNDADRRGKGRAGDETSAGAPQAAGPGTTARTEGRAKERGSTDRGKAPGAGAQEQEDAELYELRGTSKELARMLQALRGEGSVAVQELDQEALRTLLRAQLPKGRSMLTVEPEQRRVAERQRGGADERGARKEGRRAQKDRADERRGAADRVPPESSEKSLSGATDARGDTEPELTYYVLVRYVSAPKAESEGR